MINKPSVKPNNPNFSSGPCSKHPGYSLDLLKDTPFGRSHRSKLGKALLAESIDRTKKILGIPEDYRVGIVPASDTGAVEMAMWNLLGERGVDVIHFESFGSAWAKDIKKQLKLTDVTDHFADYGRIPDLSKVNFDNDVVFTWNGTTSGVKVPNGDFIPSDRKGLTICDATSAVFAMEIPWDKLDVTTYSWQKVLGGEAAHGMLILSPRAVERVINYTPAWPIPKIFNLKKGDGIDEALFEGSTINTPSMLCNQDYLAALNWTESVGGLEGLIARSNSNLAVVEEFVAKHDWISFLAADPAIRSNTSVCLNIDLEKDKVKQLIKLLDEEGVAYDIGAYRDAPDGLRIWCGATIESEDVRLMLEWLEWAYHQVK